MYLANIGWKITLFLWADYSKQVQDNQNGVRLTKPREEARPPSLYYDRINNRQIQNLHEALQTTQGIIPFNNTPSNTQNIQDVRFMDVGNNGISKLVDSQASLWVEIEFPNDKQTQVSLLALIVTWGRANTSLSPRTNVEPMESDSNSDSSSFKDSP